MNKSRNAITQFTDKVPVQLHELADKLIDLVISNFPTLDYAVKWNQLTFSLDNDFHHWLFAVKATKKSVNIVFHFGGLLDDPSNYLIKGESYFFRKIEYRTNEEICPEKLTFFITQAISRLEYFKANWKTLNKQ